MKPLKQLIFIIIATAILFAIAYVQRQEKLEQYLPGSRVINLNSNNIAWEKWQKI
jgi:hypothetical protein